MRRTFLRILASGIAAVAVVGCSHSDLAVEPDKPTYVQPIPKDAGSTGLAAPDALVNVVAYHWKSHTVLDEVAVVLEDQTGNRSIEKGFTSRILPVGTYQLSVSPTASTGTRETAVDLKDALATLKLAIGMESINGTDTSGKTIEVSAYQRAAADFNADGRVDLKDALEILKYSIGVPVSSLARWQYFHDTEVIGTDSPPKVELAGTKRDVLVNETTSVGVAALLTGDVDGSWRPSQTTPQVDPTYYTGLVSALQATDKSATLARWGMADANSSTTKTVVSQTYQDGVETISYSDGTQVKSGSRSLSVTFSTDGLFKYLTYLFDDNSVKTVTKEAPLFNGKPNLLPDISELVAGICNNSIEGSLGPNLGIVDLNNDGVKDIVTTYWCGHRPFGEVYNGPTPNTLLVFLSDKDGKYILGNKPLFGSNIVDIGGQGGKMAIADFNLDGKPDVGIGVSKEDGRAIEGSGLSWNSPQVMLVSKADGTYDVTRFIPTSTGSVVQAVDNPLNGSDFVYATDAGAPATAFRWSGNSWTKISTYPAVNVGMNFAPRSSSFTGSQLLITNSTNQTDGSASLELKILTDGLWTITSRYAYPGRMVDNINWNGQKMQTQRSTVQGIDMLYSTFEDSCFLKMRPTSTETILLARITGFPLPPNWDSLSVVDQRWLTSVSLLVPFDMKGNALTPNSEQIFIAPLTDRFFFRYRCVDINGDGYQDVVINTNGSNPWGTIGAPIFYINNKQGKLVRVNPKGIPQPPQSSSGWADSFSEYIDMNGDGFQDIVYYTSNQFFNCLKYSIKIEYGARNIEN